MVRPLQQSSKGVADNTKDVDVPATYLEKANFLGPFTAGVNQAHMNSSKAGDEQKLTSPYLESIW